MKADGIRGFGYLLRGFRLLLEPGIWLYALIPLAITLIVSALLFWLATAYFGVLLDRMLPPGDGWLWTLLRAVLWPLFVLALILVWYFSFTVISNLIGAPFNGLLAEKVETHLTAGNLANTGGLKEAVRDYVPAVLNELRKVAYYALWAVPLLILFLIPGINVLAPILWALFMAWMLALEYLEYPMENHHLPFKQIRKDLRQHRTLTLGFGAAVLGATLIPGLNLLVMPAAVAGATTMWVEQIKTGE